MKLVLAFLALTFLTACGSTSPFKVNKKVIDDRNVYVQKPLTVPPLVDQYIEASPATTANYNQDTAFQALFNESLDYFKGGQQTTPLTTADNAFLQEARATGDYDKVKEQILKETLAITKKNNGLVNKILFWQVDETLQDPKDQYTKLGQ